MERKIGCLCPLREKEIYRERDRKKEWVCVKVEKGRCVCVCVCVCGEREGGRKGECVCCE